MVTRATLVLILAGTLAGVFTGAAQASDHIWRVWCDGTPRPGVFDTSIECWELANGLETLKAGCRDPYARQLASEVLTPGACAEVAATHDCTCRPERLE
jgi:hypothetical protein